MSISKTLFSLVPLVVAGIACTFGGYFADKELSSTSEAYGRKVQATEAALEALKAQATIDAAMREPESLQEPDAPAEEAGCATDAECSNSGTHVYAMSVQDTAQCTAGGAGQVLQEFEFEISFSPGLVSIDQVDSDYLQEFQSVSQNNYVGANQNGSVQKVTFTTEGFLVETMAADAKCLVYTRGN